MSVLPPKAAIGQLRCRLRCHHPYGGAKPADQPFATTVHCVDDEITPCVRVHPGDKTRDYHPVALVT
jgi:hypothetical protein